MAYCATNILFLHKRNEPLPINLLHFSYALTEVWPRFAEWKGWLTAPLALFLIATAKNEPLWDILVHFPMGRVFELRLRHLPDGALSLCRQCLRCATGISFMKLQWLAGMYSVCQVAGILMSDYDYTDSFATSPNIKSSKHKRILRRFHRAASRKRSSISSRGKSGTEFGREQNSEWPHSVWYVIDTSTGKVHSI